MPDKPRGRAGSTADAEQIPASRHRAADFPAALLRGSVGDVTRKGPPPALRNREGWNDGVAQLGVGGVIIGSALAGPLGAIAAGPDTSAPDRELVLGLRVAPPFVMRTPDGIWTGISVELWRHLAEQLKYPRPFLDL